MSITISLSKCENVVLELNDINFQYLRIKTLSEHGMAPSGWNAGNCWDGSLASHNSQLVHFLDDSTTKANDGKTLRCDCDSMLIVVEIVHDCWIVN